MAARQPSLQSFASMLHPDRLLPADPGVRRIARTLYESTKALPIVSPHGHCDPAAFADDRPFDSPATELVTKDHYVLRMLYSQGVPLEALGVQPLDGSPAATDGRQIWRELATRYTLFRGTPSKLWLDHTLEEIFGVEEPLGAENADAVYDEISARLTQGGLPAARALRALRHRVPGHDRRRPRSTGVARAAPPVRLGGTRRADLPPRRRRRPRPARLPRPPRCARRAHRRGHVELGRLSRRAAEPARRLRRGGSDRIGPRAPHTGHGRPVASGRSGSVRAHRGRRGTAGRRRAVPRPDAGRDGGHEPRRRARAADPCRCVAGPQSHRGGPFRPGPGRRHPHAGGLRAVASSRSSTGSATSPG